MDGACVSIKPVEEGSESLSKARTTRRDATQPLVIKEEATVVECSLIKEETEEEAIDDVKVKEEATRLHLTPAHVKSEYVEAASSWAPHMKGEDDGDNGGGAEAASGLTAALLPETSPSSESDTDDSDDWGETSKVELSKARRRNVWASAGKQPNVAAASPREYRYAGQLDFLVPYLRPSRSSQTLSGSASPPEDPSCPSASSVRRGPSRSRSPRDRSRRGGSSSAERRSQGPGAKPRLPESKLAECYHFALSLVPMLKALDDNRREAAKVRIINLLRGIDR
ncbi:uncharacterized protein ACB058_021054 [Synchiropus picturatus]